MLWLIPCAVITIRVLAAPLKRTVTPVYHGAVERWQQREPLYAGPEGMQYYYLPTFVPLFAPYHALPLRLADVLWRWTAMGGLAAGLWKFSRLMQGESEKEPPERAFFWLSLLGVPLCLGSLSNGQANAHLGVVLLWAALCMAEERAWACAVFLALAVAIKPLGIAAAGLAVMCFPRLWWRVGTAILVALAIPFLLAPWPYVQDQFLAASVHLRQSSEVTRKFADLSALLRLLHVTLGWGASIVVRAGAGAALALLSLGLLRRWPPLERALAWLAAVGTYLMLFNPMNEVNSYAMFGLPVALWTWQAFQSGRERLGWLLASMLATMALLPTLLRPWMGNSFAQAWDSAMATLFLGIFISEIVRRTSAKPALQPVHRTL